MSTLHYRVPGVPEYLRASHAECPQRPGWCTEHHTVHDDGRRPAGMTHSAAEMAIAQGHAIAAGRALAELGAVVANRAQRQAEADTRWAVQVATGGYSGLIG